MQTACVCVFSITLVWGPAIARAQAGGAGGGTTDAGQEPPQGATDDDVGDIESILRSAQEVLDELSQADDAQERRALREQATRLIETAYAQDAASPWLYYLNGRLYAETGRSFDAIDQLLKFVETREGRTQWRAFRLLGDLFRTEFTRLAKSNYEKALALNPSDPGALYGQSVCEWQLGARDEAVRLARRAVEADERHSARYVSHLATLLGRSKQWDEALGEARSALQLALRNLDERPGNRRAMELLDDQYRLLVSLLEARMNERGETDPADAVRIARYIRERSVLARTRVLRDALPVLSSALEQLPGEAPLELLSEYGSVLAELGKKDEAIEVFEQVLARDSDHAAARAYLSRLREDTDE